MGKVKIDTQSGPTPLFGAYPTVLVGAIVDGQPDFTAVAWTGVAASFPPAITVALQPHRHSLKGIKQNIGFSVNIPSVNLVNETDYCGLNSGKNPDKAVDCGFKVFYGKNKNAPLIEQCPLNHALEVLQIVNLGSHELVIGRVVETFITAECLVDGKLDPDKITPFLFTGSGYYGLGEKIGQPFKCGWVVRPEGKRSPG
jgi:flavin reductase (DIM6/NTAB) family NADH-FMN oxidoreductase RutF